jgi:hypothetical protein
MGCARVVAGPDSDALPVQFRANLVALAAIEDERQRDCLLPRVPDHSEPGKEAHFPDGVAEQRALIAQWPDIGDFSTSAASPRWFALTCVVVISLLHGRYLFVAWSQRGRRPGT